MTSVYYDSFDRFTNRIIKRWNKQGIKYNKGNINIIKYAWICSLYWANRNGEKVSEVNKVETKQLNLF